MIYILVRSLLPYHISPLIFFSEYMGNHGTKFVRPAVPTKIEKIEDPNSKDVGRLLVHYAFGESGEIRQVRFIFPFLPSIHPSSKDNPTGNILIPVSFGILFHLNKMQIGGI